VIPESEGDPRPRPVREEVEVKIPCSDLDAVREALGARSAVLSRPRHFEANELFDDDERRLSAQGRTIRLRRAAGRAILTYKGVARFQGGIKTREERETDVTDPGETEAILAGLGLLPRFRYEKYREEWRLEECSIALDETPIGTFVEVEGAPPAIRQVLLQLDLDFAAALPYSYSRLYRDRRQEDPSLPPDMVFLDSKSGGA
jgi:adenylate cyclase class 2